MAMSVVMPRLSDTMEEGKILRWLKREGDRVEGGEIIAEIQTDKADIEMEAFGSGTLRKILIGAGQSAPVGHPIGVIAEEDEDISTLLPPVTGSAVQSATSARPGASAPVSPAFQAVTAGRVKASPLAKRLARAQGIDLSAVKGSGPGGRIIRRDLAAMVPSTADVGQRPPLIAGRVTAMTPPAPSVEFEDRELSPMRRAIAKRVAQSTATVPHFYLTVEVAMEKAAELRQAMQDQAPDLKVTFTDIIIRAVVMALRRHPAMNASFMDDRIRVYSQVNIGIAVALEDGLINPVLRDCGKKSLIQIAKEAKNLVERARALKLRSEEYVGATFTVSNLGMYEIEEFTAIINPPEAAILAVGRIQSKPVVANGDVQIGQRMRMTLSCDHRAVDGAIGAIFLQEVKRLLEQPLQLVVQPE
ncbi:MAG: 2-oxo acid dehydrogenase subunit E2 [Candidatus Methylomirabilis oxygeniifera]|uniref:Dihydrolipoamide acetyltransferase component of pyruvate dehydrogenase complex n=1 Tax=Methylomirabilis oxygeniifera TaxID=671143 RepID=D5MFX5_METO1|nr:MAG: 2-oxo acid dehydrogenase subunit E2 [Candidatus Methylomirabilis oxyfera]CBE68656.1 Dihydrolipoyllysine-residue acetyltransferase component of pyruvate dehydrogenase complex (E2) (Dihydrolipoamide acetyltransferase component of pyruvate dehydrogenase complex) [Candidatus Methylomirabilis oxyfera]